MGSPARRAGRRGRAVTGPVRRVGRVDARSAAVCRRGTANHQSSQRGLNKESIDADRPELSRGLHRGAPQCGPDDHRGADVYHRVRRPGLEGTYRPAGDGQQPRRLRAHVRGSVGRQLDELRDRAVLRERRWAGDRRPCREPDGGGWHGGDDDEVRGQWRDEARGKLAWHLGQQPQPDRRHDRQPGPAAGSRAVPSDRPRFARSEGGFGQAWREWRAGVVPERLDHADQPALPPSGPGRAVEAHPRAGRPGGERRRVGTRRECHRHQHGSERGSRWERHRHGRRQGRVGSRHRHVRAQPG